MSESVRPHRRQPNRPRHPWDSPGKNTGVGCHFLLHCMKVKSQSEVAQSCPTLSDSMDCSLPGSSVHEIFQARVFEGWDYCKNTKEKRTKELIFITLCMKISTRKNIFSPLERPLLTCEEFKSNKVFKIKSFLIEYYLNGHIGFTK